MRPTLCAYQAVNPLFNQSVGIAVTARRAREHAEDLIADGRDGLSLPLLSRQRERLLDRRRREALARAVDDLVGAAERWPKTFRCCRPVFNVQLVRAGWA
jgi:hypothetical protein